MSLARNAVFNLLGAAVPAVLSIVTVPFIVRALGATDFGLLTLVTAIVGYFALLDVNLTAGTTKYVAQFQAVGDTARLNQTLSFGLVVYTGIGLIGMAGLLLFAEPLVVHAFSVPADRQATAVLAVRVAALGFAFGQVQAYLQSLPGALLRFDVSGRVEAVFGTVVPLLTVALLALGLGLVEVVALRVLMSALQAGVLLQRLRGLLPGLAPAWPDRALQRQLVDFSAFAFLSRLASLTYAHADKLIIGARLGVAQVTFFAVPSTLANRVMALVGRLSGVMFPHASALAATGQVATLQRQYLAGSRYLFYLNGAIALTLAGLAPPLLRLWIGPDFATQGAAVMALVALAQWVDSMTHLPSLVNDGLGHPRVSGSLALVRAAMGLGLIALGVAQAGIVGAAWGHLLASLVMSAVFLVYVHGRTVPVALGALLGCLARPAALLLPLGALGLACGWPLAGHPAWLAGQGWWALGAVLAALVAGHGLLAWWGLLDGPQRDRLQAQLRQAIRQQRGHSKVA